MSEGKILNTLLCNEEGKIIAIIWLLMDEECFFIHSVAEKKGLYGNILINMLKSILKRE